MSKHPHYLIIHNERLPITIRRHKKAKHMIVRYQPLRHEISLTLPRYVTIKQGLHFVREKRKWIAEEVAGYVNKVSFVDGTVISLLGEDYKLRHIGGRGLVKLSHAPQTEKLLWQNHSLFEATSLSTANSLATEKTLLVPGDEEFISRRVRDWLKHFAKEVIGSLVKEKTALLGVEASKISLRDTSSHWGSCGEDGSLSFSWRLVLAPYNVLEYVVCHEVAHLKELNHSKEFWQLVESICPNWQHYKNWLAKEGSALYRFAF